VPEEAQEQNEQHHHGVVHAEVVEVAPHTHRRFFDRVRVREGVECEYLFPWLVCGERRACGCRGACDEVGSGVR